MKKILVMAMAAAALLTSCTKEKEDIGGNGGGEELKNSTYASFSFNLSKGGTRAAADYDPTDVAANDANDALIGTGDLYILVFNTTTNVLEYKAAVTGTSHTALLTAGQKKIFVLANMGAATGAADNVQTNLKTVVPATLAASTTLAPIGTTASTGFVVGTMTLSDFYNVAFDAGDPKMFSVTKTDPVTTPFSVKPLYTVIDITHGLPMSNHNNNTFTLTANVSTTAITNNTDAAVESGTHVANKFAIKLDYLGAKARMIMDLAAVNAKPGQEAVITLPKYTIKNLAKYTSLVQGYVAGSPKSLYHNFAWTATPVQTDFDPHFDQASNTNITVPTSNGSYVYVPENTHTSLLNGQASFFALNVTYKPKSIILTVDHNELGNTSGGPSPRLNTTADSYDGGTLTSYVYVTTPIDGLSANIKYYKNARVLADAAWIQKFDKPTTDASYTAAAADALVSSKFKTFTGAQSWYRMNIGTGDAPNTVYGVLRGNAYTAEVKNITGPGEPTEGDLFKDPEKPVDAKTWISVTITAKGWNALGQTGDL